MNELTLRWLMEDSGITGIRCICCDDALDNEIAGVQIMDNPDTIRFHKPGDLVITTGFLLQERPIFRKTWVHELVDRHCPGVLFKTNRFFEQVPSDILKDAQHYHLPILELPYNYAISQVNRMLMYQMYQRLETRAADILQFRHSLTSSLVSGNDMNDSFALCARYLEHPVLFFDRHLQYLYQGFPKQSAYAVHREQLCRENCQFLPEVKDQILKDLHTAISTRCMLHIADTDYAGVLWPVMTANGCCGYFFVLEDSPLSEFVTTEVSQFLPILALTFSDVSASQALQTAGESELLNRLFRESGLSREELLQLQRSLRLKEDQHFACLSLQLNKNSRSRHAQILSALLKSLTFSDIHFRHLHTGDAINVLVIADHDADLLTRLDQLSELLTELSSREVGRDVTIGISNFHHQLSEVSQCFREAQKAIFLGLQMSFLAPVFRYHDQEIFHTMYALMKKEDLRSLMNAALGPLLRFDQENNADLVRTLETLVFHEWNLKSSAAAMYIHRNTICYRKDQILEILHLDLHNPHQVSFVNTGIYALKLLEWYYKESAPMLNK